MYVFFSNFMQLGLESLYGHLAAAGAAAVVLVYVYVALPIYRSRRFWWYACGDASVGFDSIAEALGPTLSCLIRSSS